MDQCAGLTLRQPFERFGGPRFVARQLLVLTHLERAAVCAILSDTVGTPNTRTPPDFFGIGTPFIGGGM